MHGEIPIYVETYPQLNEILPLVLRACKNIISNCSTTYKLLSISVYQVSHDFNGSIRFISLTQQNTKGLEETYCLRSGSLSMKSADT